ncbi:MAG: DUF6348 family protein [Nannocystaceae bacterium]
MKVNEVVELAIETICGGSAADDDELIAVLVEAGALPAIASRVAVFLPMAFGRVFLGGVGGASFCRTFGLADAETDATRELVLEEEPVFVEALAAARRGWDRDVVLAVAGRGAELAAINRALEADTPLQDIELGPTVVATARLLPFQQGERTPVSYAVVELPGASTRLDSLLGEVVAAHAIDGEPRSISMSGAVFSSRTGPGSFIVQIDVRVDAPRLEGRTVVESCAGVGKGIDAAVDDAFGKFVRGSLHVLLAALVDESMGGEQVQWETWRDVGSAWRVCTGLLLRQRTVPDALDYGGLLDALRARWLQQPGSRSAPHWLRVWHMVGPEGSIGAEVLLDGEPWEAGFEALRVDAWPVTGSMYSLRHFMVLLPLE